MGKILGFPSIFVGILCSGKPIQVGLHKAPYETQNGLRFGGRECAIHRGKAIHFHFGAGRVAIGNDLCRRHLQENKLLYLLIVGCLHVNVS